MIDIERFKRHVIMKEIGEAGQEKLLESSVLVIGAGGLGSPILLYLCAAGIGKIGVMEFDKVELSNLQRQIIHSTSELGKNKLDSATSRLKKLNPYCKVIGFNQKANMTNLPDIISKFDIVIDAVDNLKSRYEINKVCADLKKPLVHGSVNEYEGLVMLILPGESPCYNCVFPQEFHKENIKEVGVISPLPGIIGSIQALISINYLLNKHDTIKNFLYYFDGTTLELKRIALHSYQGCEICL